MHQYKGKKELVYKKETGTEQNQSIHLHTVNG